jgi:DNA-directed RNA polymerase specialized sigma24 family protein
MRDASLIRLSLKDPDHFKTIFERHGPALHRYLSKRARRSVVDDLVSERLSRLFPQRDHVVAGLVSRRRRSRLWAAHMNPSVTTGFRS